MEFPLPLLAALGTVAAAYLVARCVSMARAGECPFPHGKSKRGGEDEEKKSEPPRNFTLAQLKEFDGTPVVGIDGKETGESKPIYVSIKGVVYDVSEAKDFYGPEGSYHVFAGRDATTNLAKMSFDEADLNVMKWGHLSFGEREALDGWIETFQVYKQYPEVGRVVESATENPRKYTVEELREHDGTGPIPTGYAAAPILVGVAGRVFDMSFGGSSHYAKGGAYHLFAGRDASRALALMSFDAANLDKPDTSDLTEEQRTTLQEWVDKFEKTRLYPVVGTL